MICLHEMIVACCVEWEVWSRVAVSKRNERWSEDQRMVDDGWMVISEC